MCIFVCIVFVCVGACMCVYVCVCVCMCMCLYDQLLQELVGEINTFNTLGRHKHLAQLLGVSSRPQSEDSRASVCMVMEYAPMASLDVVLDRVEELVMITIYPQNIGLFCKRDL